MKKLIIACIAIFALAGCLDVSSDGNGSGNDYSHENDNRDQSIHDSNVSGSHGEGDFTGEVADDIPNDNDLTPIECKRANGFWCSQEQKCLNRTGASGTCPNAR